MLKTQPNVPDDLWAQGAEPTLDEASLIEAVTGNRNLEAFATLVACCAPKVESHLMWRGASTELARNLPIEVFEKIWTEADTFESARDSAAAWIYTVTRNCWVDARGGAARNDARPDAHHNHFLKHAENTRNRLFGRGHVGPGLDPSGEACPSQ